MIQIIVNFLLLPKSLHFKDTHFTHTIPLRVSHSQDYNFSTDLFYYTIDRGLDDTIRITDLTDISLNELQLRLLTSKYST